MKMKILLSDNNITNSEEKIVIKMQTCTVYVN